MKNSKISKKLAIAGLILYVMALLISFMNGSFFFVLLFNLPSFLIMLIAYYLKRPLGTIAISIFSMILSVMTFSSLSFSFPLLLLALLLFFFAAILSIPKKRELKRWGISIIINIALFLIFLPLIPLSVEVPCSFNFIPIYLFPLLLSAVIVAIIFLTPSNICMNAPGPLAVDLALSLLFWGLVVGYPSLIYMSLAGVGTACGGSLGRACTVTLATGLFFYTSVALSTGSFILSWSIRCSLNKKRERG